jgi:hypothetical protein
MKMYATYVKDQADANNVKLESIELVSVESDEPNIRVKLSDTRQLSYDDLHYDLVRTIQQHDGPLLIRGKTYKVVVQRSQ